MSVYSGFATRIQQTQYDTLLFNIMTLFALRITKFYRNEAADNEGFFDFLHSQNKQLKKMEKKKYMEPKYSTIVTSLLNKIVSDDRYLNKSETSVSHPELAKPSKQAHNDMKSSYTFNVSDNVSERIVSLERIVERKEKKQKNRKKSKRCETSVVEAQRQRQKEKEKQRQKEREKERQREKQREYIKKMKIPTLGRFRIEEDSENQVLKSKSKYMSEILKKSSKIDRLQNEASYTRDLREENTRRSFGISRFRSKMYCK